MRPNRPTLLTLDIDDCVVLRDALNLYVEFHARAGGIPQDEARADALTERLCEIIGLGLIDGQQTLRHMGIGRSAGRPQG